MVQYTGDHVAEMEGHMLWHAQERVAMQEYATLRRHEQVTCCQIGVAKSTNLVIDGLKRPGWKPGPMRE